MNFNKIIIPFRSITAGMLCCMAVSATAMADINIKASIDSAYIMMGRQTSLNVLLSAPSDIDGRFEINRNDLPAEIEYRDSIPVIEKSTPSAGRMQIKASYIIQSFDSGDYRIPGIMYVTGNDTIFSNAVNLKVVPVEASADDEIVNERSPLDAGRKMFDWLPTWWYWILIGLVVIGVGVVLYLIMSKRIVVKLPGKAPLPPYVIARQALDNIKSQRLWADGRNKAYYTALTDVVRNYIRGRYGVLAPELTSNETLIALKSIGLSDDEMNILKSLLSTADFVKFAKYNPSGDDNLKSFNQADSFVELTKPVETSGDDNTVADNSDGSTPSAPLDQTEIQSDATVKPHDNIGNQSNV